VTRPLLVYDGSSPLFRRAAAAFARCSGDLKPVPWQSDAVQAFLDAQFGSRPFAFVLVEGESVHVGRETVERVLRREGVGAPVAGLFGRLYPLVAAPFGRAVHGREPADLGGTFSLKPDAAVHLRPLRRGYSIPVEEA
jgi:hypothetical protein